MNMETKHLETPLSASEVEKLHAGDNVTLTGYIYTGRDAAHKKMVDLLQKGENLPFDPKGQIIYFVGPTPAKPGQVIGSAGPTTSGRMNKYSPHMIAAGLKGMIGKGEMGPEVAEALQRHKGVYFVATGGAAALIAKRITESEVVAYEELGPEAVRRLKVVEFPMIVAQDCHGGNIYVEGVEKYKR
ncbi:MAG: fumarate hydratase [candidate division Zixibacteria bacterium RBG_16_53_22]|nr:MAG: fumarate hydratase [candidate division Zixibacteria bacterium RBG_16_53_22]